MRTSVRPAAPVLGLLAAAVLLAACGGAQPERDGTGAVVATEEAADVFSLAVGDCTNDGEQTEGEVTSVEAVPCGAAHDNEVYHAEDLPDGDFPGEEEVATAADEACYTAFEPFVGLAYEDSRLDYFPLTPTQDSWEQGEDREVLCLVYDAAGEALEGSAEGLAE